MAGDRLLNLQDFVNEETGKERRTRMLAGTERAIQDLGAVTPRARFGASLGASLGQGFLEGLTATQEQTVLDGRSAILNDTDMTNPESIRSAIGKAQQSGETALALSLSEQLQSARKVQERSGLMAAQEGRAARSEGRADRADRRAEEGLTLRKQELSARDLREKAKTKRDADAFAAKQEQDAQDAQAAVAKAAAKEQAAKIRQASKDRAARNKSIVDSVQRVKAEDVMAARQYLDQNREKGILGLDFELFGADASTDVLMARDLAERGAMILVDNPEMELTDRYNLAMGIEPTSALGVNRPEDAMTEEDARALVGKGKDNLTVRELEMLRAFKDSR